MNVHAERTPAASFRDPGGRLVLVRDRVLRFVNAAGLDDVRALLASPAAQSLFAAGALVPSRILERDEVHRLDGDAELRSLSASKPNLVLEHERIPFPSFPYEWPPEMLYEAALLTLDLALRFLPENLGLKDATPYNVLFRGPNPVFIDVLSFERRHPADPVWRPYAQFIRAFLLPLLANRRFGVPLDQLLLGRHDGIEPDEVYRWTSPLGRLSPALLSLVSIPVWLGNRRNQDDPSIYRQELSDSPEKAAFILRAILNGLRRRLRKTEPPPGKTSAWFTYLDSNNNYSAEHFDAKRHFVESAVADLRPRRVLDVGCNTGLFSAIAARAGASVVAVDADPVVVGETWRIARAEQLDILPVVANIARPTPATGWRNREFPSFLDRACGSFDMVLMLAVLHHILITERVPLDEVVDLAAELTTGSLLIEFIAPQDSMFRRLVRGRESLFADLTLPAFEAAFQRRFDVERMAHVEGTFRWLYVFRKRS